jgi:hypothetical protein
VALHYIKVKLIGEGGDNASDAYVPVTNTHSVIELSLVAKKQHYTTTASYQNS